MRGDNPVHSGRCSATAFTPWRRTPPRLVNNVTFARRATPRAMGAARHKNTLAFLRPRAIQAGLARHLHAAATP